MVPKHRVDSIKRIAESIFLQVTNGRHTQSGTNLVYSVDQLTRVISALSEMALSGGNASPERLDYIDARLRAALEAVREGERVAAH